MYSPLLPQKKTESSSNIFNASPTLFQTAKSHNNSIARKRAVCLLHHPHTPKSNPKHTGLTAHFIPTCKDNCGFVLREISLSARVKLPKCPFSMFHFPMIDLRRFSSFFEQDINRLTSTPGSTPVLYGLEWKRCIYGQLNYEWDLRG